MNSALNSKHLSPKWPYFVLILSVYTKRWTNLVGQYETGLFSHNISNYDIFCAREKNSLKFQNLEKASKTGQLCEGIFTLSYNKNNKTTIIIKPCKSNHRVVIIERSHTYIGLQKVFQPDHSVICNLWF